MIIINCGMPKSGTTLVMEYQKNLIRHLMPTNGLEEFQKHFHSEYFPNVNRKTAKVWRHISTQYGDFLVKTHFLPSFWIQQLIANNEAKVTFCFRDPRDTMLSAIDHGERTRKSLDSSGAFANIVTLRDAIPLAKSSINLYYQWRRYGKALFIRYEELMLNKMEYLKKIATYFQYSCEEQTLYNIFQKHESLKEQAWNFNKGIINRWKTEMSQEELALCNRLFKNDLVDMGYEAP